MDSASKSGNAVKTVCAIQIILALIAILLLLTEDFGGYYQYGYYQRTWGYIYFGSGIFTVFFGSILVVGLLVIVYAGYKRALAPSAEDAAKYARLTLYSGLFVGGLALIGGVAFAASMLWEDVTEWWFDMAFYGPLVGGFLSAWIGWLARK